MLFQLQGRNCFFAQCFVCVRFRITLTRCAGLCSRSVRDYAHAVRGIALPYYAGLCSRSVRDYASAEHGTMLPQCAGLRSRSARDYASSVYGIMLTHSMRRPCKRCHCVHDFFACGKSVPKFFANANREKLWLQKIANYDIMFR